MELRPYQQAAREAFWTHIRDKDTSPCIVLPTGGGKTLVLASLCQDAIGWGGRVLILSHVKELLEQSANTLRRFGIEAGIYSAGLRRRDTDSQILVAGIQSIYQRAAEIGPFDVCLIDEAHLIGLEGEGRYRTFLADARVVNPNLRIGGLTATPYRTGEGKICTPDGYLNEICYEISVRELIQQGYLCNLRSKVGETKVDTSGLHVRAGEYIDSEMELLFTAEEVLGPTVNEIVAKGMSRHSVLIFCSGIRHAELVRDRIRDLGHDCRMVIGDTPSAERAATLEAFKLRGFKYLVNVGVLTTGFDATGIDMVALLKATMSPGLFYQMVGRGFRLHPGKEHCLVLDFGTNISRHGPVDEIKVREPGEAGPAPVKECPECHEMAPIAARTCPDCGFEFPPPSEPEGRKVAASASEKPILSTEVVPPAWAKVTETDYIPHRKKGAPDTHPRTLRVKHKIGWNQYVSEWVCVEHGVGFARHKAEQWWARRCNLPCPTTVEEAIAMVDCLAPTLELLLDESGEYPEIKAHRLGEIPAVSQGDAAETAAPKSIEIYLLSVGKVEGDIPF